MRRFFYSTFVAAIAMLLPTWAYGSDQETAQKIAESLRASGRLQDYSIGVKFEEGKAYLLGRVASPAQAKTAVELAKQLPYVTSVENRLEVKSSAKQDFEVEPTSLDDDTRTVGRDEAVFGSAPAVPSKRNGKIQTQSFEGEPQPVAAPSLKPAPTTGRTAGIHGHRNSGAVQADMGGSYAGMQGGGRPIPAGMTAGGNAQRVAYDQPHMPCYSWPSYASYPNYAAVQYPTQHSASAWPYIGPFYPYPQVPLGWRKVTLEWKDGWWFLDFNDHCRTFRR